MRNSQRRIVLLFAATFLLGCVSSATKTNLEAGFRSLDDQQYDDAMAAADKQLADSPNGAGAAEAWYLRGRALEGRASNNASEAHANFSAARDAYQQALRLNPARSVEAKIHAGLANTSYVLEDYATAQSEWSRAYPDLTDPGTRSYTLYRIGLCEQRLGQFAQADQTFSRVQQEYAGTDAADKARRHQGYHAFMVQLATYQNPKTADTAIENLRRQGTAPTKTIDPAGRTIVLVGPAPNYAQATALRNRFAGVYADALIVP